MNLSYKIIAKIIAVRLKKLMPMLVDPQQTGFIHGRSITNNLLSLKLGADWAEMTQQDCIFMKLDFVKAYDRIDHTFLLGTLRAFGFSENSLQIFKGLTTKGWAKLHVNQDFSKPIPVQRGVRQGCPLAPYLFALCTQVLMGMLKEQQHAGYIRGLKITEEEDLLHQIFADDTGLFLQMDQQVFLNTTHTLQRFETASGAKLNLGKTLILPLRPMPTPAWLAATQCKIATPSDRFHYLGILAGNNILEEEIIRELQEKYQKKLDHWANRLLTWPEKVLLAQNVLKALPNYILMAIGMSAKGTRVLERITADFLWGRGPTGKEKRPLIAWATFARKKTHGGLGWPIMQDLTQAEVKMEPGQRQLPADTTPRMATAILESTDTLEQHESQVLLKIFRAAKITKLGQLVSEAGEPISLQQYCQHKAIQLSHGQITVTDKLQAVLPVNQMDNSKWTEAPGWSWENTNSGNKTPWELSTCCTTTLRTTRSSTEDGKYSNDNTKLHGPADGRTSGKGPQPLELRCGIELETLTHEIWTCPVILERQKWALWILFQDAERTTSQLTGEHIITTMDKALLHHKENPAALLLILTMWRCNWSERNDAQFNSKNTYRGLFQILDEVQREIHALTSRTGNSDRITEALQTAETTIQYWHHETTRWLKGA
ncbi:hypothetical protein R1sor_021646 [Riccia sorocarpa]|uniref:Reverse transcriptase domain-containing protein n=1 Tax=Riccia sorocarpa TaxID=122646 RepID=A0ABD3GHM0_9MARC